MSDQSAYKQINRNYKSKAKTEALENICLVYYKMLLRHKSICHKCFPCLRHQSGDLGGGDFLSSGGENSHASRGLSIPHDWLTFYIPPPGVKMLGHFNLIKFPFSKQN